MAAATAAATITVVFALSTNTCLVDSWPKPFGNARAIIEPPVNLS